MKKKKKNIQSLNTEKLKALFDSHVSAVVLNLNLNSFVNKVLLQIDTNGLGLHCGIKLTALVDIEDCHSVAVLIPSHHFHSLRILEEIIQHQLKLLDSQTKNFAHNYLLNKNQLNLFTNA